MSKLTYNNIYERKNDKNFNCIIVKENENITKYISTVTNSNDIDKYYNNLLNSFLLNDEIIEVIYQKSSWCNENQTEKVNNFDNFKIQSIGNRTTENFNPFVIIRTKLMDYHIHVLPIGDFEITINKKNNSEYEILVGLKSEGLNICVKKKDQIKLPDIVIYITENKNLNESIVDFHKYLNSNIELKKIPVIYNSWFYDFDKFYVNDLKEQALLAKELGVEVFAVDAGWYGPSNDDWFQATGDWDEKLNGAFYGKMEDFSAYIINKGMKFGLWLEPERICKGTPIFNEHPEYFIHAKEHNYYIDLTKEVAREYYYNTISKIISKYNVTWLKLDFNFSLTKDPYNSNFYYYSYYLYQMLDKLRKNYPDIILECCDSGAMKFDILNNSKYDVHFLSDNVNAYDALTMYKNLLYRMTPSSLFKWTVFREVDGIPEYTKPLKNAKKKLVMPKGAIWEYFESIDPSFLFTFMVSSHIGLSGDMRLSNQTKVLLKKYIDIYKDNRMWIGNSHGIIHEVEGFISYSLWDNKKNTALVFIYRLDGESETCQIELPKLDKHKYNYIDAITKETFDNIKINIPDKYSARLLLVKKL